MVGATGRVAGAEVVARDGVVGPVAVGFWAEPLPDPVGSDRNAAVLGWLRSANAAIALSAPTAPQAVTKTG